VSALTPLTDLQPPLESGAAVGPARESRDRWGRRIRRLLGLRLGLVGLALVLLAIVAAVASPLVAPYNPTVIDPAAILQGPSWAHLLGTDELGHDVLSEVVYGSRVSMVVAFGSVFLAGCGGGLLGLIAGFYGGFTDNALMRLIDAVMAFPGLVLALVLVTALGANVLNVTVAISVTTLPIYARLVRGQVLQIKRFDFVESARGAGASSLRLLFVHIAPGTVPVLITQSSLNAAVAILTEASLSFLGLGVPPPTPTWGGLLQQSYGLVQTAPWISLSAGGAIFVVVLGFTLLGNSLRDLMDPRIGHAA
jgi:ABC-type dipeptide/oligopeptide/nickel transport system permease subunit